MKYLVLLYRSEDTLECEAYWTEDHRDAVRMADNEEYHSATLITTESVTEYRM